MQNSYPSLTLSDQYHCTQLFHQIIANYCRDLEVQRKVRTCSNVKRPNRTEKILKNIVVAYNIIDKVDAKKEQPNQHSTSEGKEGEKGIAKCAKGGWEKSQKRIAESKEEELKCHKCWGMWR